MKFIYEIETVNEGNDPPTPWDKFNVVARNFEQAVQKANEEIAAADDPKNADFIETIHSCRAIGKVGR